MLYKIIDNLYLATYTDAQNFSPENAFIVNCTKDLPMVSSQGIRIAVDDNGDNTEIKNMFLAFNDTVEIIHDKISKNIPVVVHCLAGIQRSPTVIAAYLMAKHNFTLENSIILIRSKKPNAFFWAVNFRDALEGYHYVVKNKDK